MCAKTLRGRVSWQLGAEGLAIHSFRCLHYSFFVCYDKQSGIGKEMMLSLDYFLMSGGIGVPGGKLELHHHGVLGCCRLGAGS